MHRGLAFERLGVLYIPYILALLFKSDPITSYFLAWAGSFFIFYIVFTGWIKPIPKDRPLAAQLMRPLFLVHIIFAGYTCCTSIFYFFNLLGYENFVKVAGSPLIDVQKLELTAQCQRYYCLGHAAFVTGIMVCMKYPVKTKVKVSIDSVANLLFRIALITLPVSIFFMRVPGLSQFSNQFSSLSFIAGTLALAFAIPQKKTMNTIICLGLYFSNLYSALTSGFKEPIIISVLVLGIFLYPVYKKIVLITFLPLLLLLFFFLPTYAAVFRANAWNNDVSADDATELALHAALDDSESKDDTNWGFLVNRLSEIDMFTTFVNSTPTSIPFYDFDLIQQSLKAVVPRIFWPGKPSTEEMVMQRVYASGVINPNSKVSAKPAYIVDAYLSGGTFGIIIAMVIYGAAAQLISQKAEEIFGGYMLGTALIFSGLFQIFWRGLSFEFILNNVFWSYVSMLIIAKILTSRRILQPIQS